MTVHHEKPIGVDTFFREIFPGDTVRDQDGKEYTVGALVMSNFGGAGRLMIDGKQVGREIKAKLEAQQDKGSIIMLLATDVPLSERQLKPFRFQEQPSASLRHTPPTSRV